MIKRCTENEILGKISGVIGVNCATEDYLVTPASAESDINQDITDDGDLFCVLGGEGNAYNGQDAQTATSSDGETTYVVTKAKEGYTVDFPPYKSVNEKVHAIAEYFNGGLFLVVKMAGKYRVYGVAKNNRTKLAPFKVSSLNNVLPNGRFASGTTLPTNQLSFVIEDTDLAENLGYVELSDIEENTICHLYSTGANNIGKLYAGDILPVTDGQHIALPNTATLTASMFETTGTLSTVAVSGGDIEFTHSTSGTYSVTQVLPIDGLWTFETIQIVES
jgi:hypothetical protein